jgi:putative transposase
MNPYKEYPHCPPHLFISKAKYLITGSVVRKQHLLESHEKREYFCKTLFEQASRLNWQLEAWACMSNHYHFIAQAPEDVESMTTLVRAIHSLSTRNINAIDRQPGRRVWWNYWDTCIRNEGSYLSMLRYVHENPIKHRLVDKAEDYPFCSYQWFITQANPDFSERVFSQPIDKLVIKDDF